MAKLDTKKQEDTGMTKKEALDILLQNVAESKKQIYRGEYYTHDELWATIEQRKSKCK